MVRRFIVKWQFVAAVFSLSLALPALAADTATEDLDWQRCESAERVGRGEGEFLLQSTLHNPEKTCENLKSSADYYWLQALTLRNYLWDTGYFQPIAGLEAFQECRMQGQSAAIEASSRKLLEGCP